jgi:hypothetical protein
MSVASDAVNRYLEGFTPMGGRRLRSLLPV